MHEMRTTRESSGEALGHERCRRRLPEDGAHSRQDPSDGRNWASCASKVTGFSPESQDAAALYLKACRAAFSFIQGGRLSEAIPKSGPGIKSPLGAA